MSVNLLTLNKIKKTPLSMKLYDTLSSYILNYILSDDHSVDDKREEQTVELLKECNTFAMANNMKELCNIYDVFGLEQDAVIILNNISDYLVQEKQEIEEIDISIKIKKLKNSEK